MVIATDKEYTDETQACRKWCGMASAAAPKICRERERKGREGRKEKEKGEREEKEERGEKKERKGEESVRGRCITGAETPPWNCQKIIKDTKERKDMKGRKYSDRGQIEMKE